MGSPDNFPEKNPAPQRANAVKHGLRATDEIFIEHLKYRERVTLRKLREELASLYDPQTPLEDLIIDKIAIQNFRLLRLYRLEYKAANKSFDTPLDEKSRLHHLDRLSRYDWRIERQLKILHNRLRQIIRGRDINVKLPSILQE